ncbi:MAG: SHOCT domain-containing protein [Actinomycetales bacterium]
MMGWYGMGGGLGGWLGLGLGVLVLLGVVILTALVAARWFRDGRAVPAAANPLQILDRRFAQGEMTEDDYRQRRDVLTSH